MCMTLLAHFRIASPAFHNFSIQGSRFSSSYASHQILQAGIDFPYVHMLQKLLGGFWKTLVLHISFGAACAFSFLFPELLSLRGEFEDSAKGTLRRCVRNLLIFG